MQREQLGKWLLGAAALSTIIVPIGVDAVILAEGHMNNPAWLPHAKLHCAMSFFAAVSLGGAALAVLTRPVTDKFSMGLATFLSCSFYIGLIAAGFWPGTSYGFIGDPVLGDFPEPQIGGITIYPNVIASVITIAIALTGYWLTSQVNESGKINQPLAVKDS
ncbi:hypothetical protein NIES4071_73570 [Calothrix sp. NIES-4071]|nr:hypothetical protein NIES4071_73570 [Calothrix sp. NIES-4071]BAZ61632.1 hypothetical protein NIES4105_73520 [Calothrix sp. NIES-4105]